MEHLIATAILWVVFAIGYYVGRSRAKDAHYIKGYRDGINDVGRSIQVIMNKLKEK